MGHAIALRPDFTATELRRLATRTRDVAQARRLLAIAAIVDGASRAEAARIGGMDHATTTFLRPASMMTGDNRKKFCGQSSDHPLSGPLRGRVRSPIPRGDCPRQLLAIRHRGPHGARGPRSRPVRR
jgi:hypothetical protein